MAADIPYHRLPEDNRPSMETVPGDDHRLLDSDPLYDDDEAAPKKEQSIKFSYHPTSYIRLLALCLYISAFGVLIASGYGRAIPAIIFLSFAIFRNLAVLYFHLIGHCFIRIKIEIVGRKPLTRNPKPKVERPAWITQRRIHVAIDWLLIILLIITSLVAQTRRYRGWRYYYVMPGEVMPGCIVAWVAIPFHALASIDMGKPNRITFTNAISFDLGRDKDDDDTAPPTAYRDVESSGGIQGDMTRKTGADSPPMI